MFVLWTIVKFHIFFPDNHIHIKYVFENNVMAVPFCRPATKHLLWTCIPATSYRAVWECCFIGFRLRTVSMLGALHLHRIKDNKHSFQLFWRTEIWYIFTLSSETKGGKIGEALKHFKTGRPTEIVMTEYSPWFYTLRQTSVSFHRAEG